MNKDAIVARAPHLRAPKGAPTLFAFGPDDILEDVPFTDLGADSLALIELVEALEENLATYAAGFHIDDEDLEGLTSVAEAVDYVAAKLQVA